MGIGRRRRLALAATAAALAAAVSVAAGGAAAPSAPRGQIVFASNRGWAVFGEIYAVAPGGRPRDVSRSQAADSGVAAAPDSRTIAFWSDRDGQFEPYLSRPDGSHVRRISGVPGRSEASGTLTFTPDGSTL